MMPTQRTVTECLNELFQQYKKEEILAFVSKFIGAKEGAVESWLKGTVPRGEQLLRLKVLLDLVGCQVDGFTDLQEPTKKFAQLIALDFISIEGARDMLGYEKSDSVYAFLKGTSLMPDRMYRFMKFIEQSEDELKGMITKFRESFSKLKPLNGSYAEPPASSADPDPAQALPSPVEIRDKEVTIQPSIQLDEETLAHALVDTVRLMTSLAHAIDSGSNAQMTRHNVLFVLKRETVDDAIKVLEKIRNP